MVYVFYVSYSGDKIGVCIFRSIFMICFSISDIFENAVSTGGFSQSNLRFPDHVDYLRLTNISPVEFAVL